MNTLLLVLALILPPVEAAPSAPSAEAAAARLVPPCAPPVVGDWWVTTDCTLVGSHSAPADITVLDGVTLRLAAGASLDVDLSRHHIRIRPDGRLIVGIGARIH